MSFPYLKIKQGCRGKLAGSEEHQKAEEEAEKAPGRGNRGTSGWGDRTNRRTLSSLLEIHCNDYFEAVIAPQQPRKATKPKTRPAI